MTELATPALVGEVVILALVIGLVWVVFREVARVAVKVLLPAALLLAGAVWLGWLDETTVGNTLVAVGDGVMTGIRAVADTVADWVAATSLTG